MAGVPRSLEIFNAREQLLSADLIRAAVLASRDAQDLESARAGSFDSNAPVPASPANLLQFNGSPISGVDKAPTLTGASGFNVTVGPGSGFLYDTGFGGLTADDSPYLVARWASGQVTHSNPDPSNPRIDVIVATPASVNADAQSRTILVDPTTRAITANSVFKTSNPSATLSVVTGTAAATPITPAVPAGALPLFYVYVPAAAGSAASFAQCRASWRRTSYPMAAMSGVISGFGWIWDLQIDASAANTTLFGGTFHRVLIDGELMEFIGNLDSRFGSVKPDTANNPFGVAAATSGKVYYLYAVGGRHNPMPSFNTADGILSPVTIVESLTPPNVTHGRPTANLTVNGQTVTPAGATYVGLGYVYPSTTNRGNCIQAGDMTYFGSDGHGTTSHTTAGTGIESVTLPAALVPPFVTKLAIYADTTGTPAGSVLVIWPDNGAGAVPLGFAGIGINTGLAVNGNGASKSIGVGTITGRPAPTFSLANLRINTLHTGDVLTFAIQGVNHLVRTIGTSVNG